MAEYFPWKLSWCRNEVVCQGVCNVLEWANGLDTALCKTIHLPVLQ